MGMGQAPVHITLDTGKEPPWKITNAQEVFAPPPVKDWHNFSILFDSGMTL